MRRLQIVRSLAHFVVGVESYPTYPPGREAYVMHICNIQTDVLICCVPSDGHRTTLVVNLGDFGRIREGPSKIG